MGISLFPHNEVAYQNSVHMMKETGKAAVIHPTGTGKSFIGFQLCAQHPEAKICWLSPSEYIFRTQVENWMAAGGEGVENIKFFTYAKLILMSREELEEINPSYIILDEFHRCGAEMWEQGVRALLDCHSQAALLGLSATNIRYLDNQRDMADELFESNIASEMTLGEAIVRGILQPPKYVLSVYSYQKDLEKYKARIQKTKSSIARDAAKEYLEALRRALAQSKGLDQVFEKHMNPTGKYIVFCSNVEHLEEMIDCVPRWFSGVDSVPHIYRAHASLSESSDAFEAFKRDSSAHLKLLFCIDMLNEGVHVDDVNGVVLFRPTISPIIYKQQIGRALSAGKLQEPVIFDVVNNLQNLYSIGTIQEEMEVAIQYYRSTGEGQKIVQEDFQLYDEVGDCRALFDGLQESLTASWDMMYQLAKTFYEEQGHLEVPRRYKTAEGHSLGNWILTQRRVQSGEAYGKLDEDRMRKLDEIGMIWDSVRDIAWERNLAEAQHYAQKYGHLNTNLNDVTESGFRIGQWICQLRTYRNSGIQRKYLSNHRIAQLDELGMIWSVPDYLWEQNFAEAMAFYRANGHLDVPAKFVADSGVRLGTWVRTLRNRRKGDGKGAPLTEDQIHRLDSIGMLWSDKFARQWEQGFQEAEQYFRAFGTLSVPVTYVSNSGFKLGDWIANQRERGRDKMSAERREKLDGLGMVWKKQNPWEVRFALVQEYYHAHGNLNVPGSYVVQGIWLGKWLNEQKQIYWGKRAGKSLTQEQVVKLKSVGFTFTEQKKRPVQRQVRRCSDDYSFEVGV